MTYLKKNLAGLGWLIAGLLFILLGVLREEHLTVLRKAAAICLECIGIG